MSGRGSGRSVYDIDPNDPQANHAATKIQAVFRGHQTRRSLGKEGGEGGGGGGGMAAGEAEREPTQQELEADFDPSDKELCHAATKIQASFRGHMARKQAPKGKPEEDLSRELQKLDAKEKQ